MMIKVFETNKEGKIEFTKAELEKILNEIYKDGYNSGYENGKSKTWTWTTPYYNSLTNIPCVNTTTTTTNATKAVDDLTCALKDHKPGAGITLKTPSLTFSPDEAKTISEAFDKAIRNFTNSKTETNDVFTGLARELNF